MTQTEFCAHIGRNQGWLSRYLDGKKEADLDTLEAMAGAFGHPIAKLFDWPLTDPDEAALIGMFRALPDDARQHLLLLLAVWTQGATSRLQMPGT